MDTKSLLRNLIVIVMMTFLGNAFGQTVNEARIGETEYATLADACAAANTSGGTVTIETLVPTITMTSGVTFNKAGLNVTLKTADELLNATPSVTTVIIRGWNGGTTAANALFYLNNSSARLRTENITLDGAYNTTAKYTGRAVYVNSGDVCFTGGTTVRNFHTAEAGGAVYVGSGGNHTLIDNSSDGNVIFSNCGNEIATQNKDGAAICIQSGNIIINNSGTGTVLFEQITGNSQADGGAIGVNSSGSITLNNTSTGAIRFVDCVAQYGGALETDGGSITLNNSGTGTMEFLHCYTDVANEGGAIYCGGKFSTVNNGTITFTGTIGTDAEAKTKTTKGGAIYIYSSASDACSITGSGQTSFTNCKANTDGGAIYANGSVTINQTRGTSFANCTGNNGGGVYGNGTVSVTNCSFTNCTASTGTGGGIHSAKQLSVSDSVFTDCSAKTYGGAIYINGPNSTGRHTISNCTFDGHKDLDGNTVNAANGGAIYVNDGWLTLTGSQFSDLTCTANGGAVYMDGRTGDALSIEDCTFDGHDTLASTVKNASVGGAVYMNADNGITLKNLTVSDCWTSGNGGGVYADDAIISTEGTISITDCYTTGGNGGGAYFGNIANLGKAETTGNTVTFKGCHANSTSTSNGGGGAYFAGAATIHEGTTVIFGGDGENEPCYAGANGGGAYFAAAATLTGNSSFTNNTAQKGGGMYLAADATVNGATITGNSANQGGGIYALNNLTLLGNTVIEGNSLTEGSAVGNGGGVFMNNSKTLTIGATTDGDSGNNVTVSGNNTFDGDASNVHLAASGNNNATNSVLVNSKMNGLVGVCNPGAKGTQLGTQPSALLSDPNQDPHIFSDFDSRVAITNTNDPLKIFWEGDYVCKITDAEGHLLKYKSGSNYFDAKFYSVWQAFEQLNSTENNHFQYNGTPTQPAYLKMLCDYFMRKVVTMNATLYNDITLTSAGLLAEEEDNLPYIGPTPDDTIATLYKGQLNNTMINMNAANEELKVENITIDGRARADQATASGRAGGMFLVNANNAALTIGEMATLQNINVNRGNSTIQVQNSGNANIVTGALFDNCRASVNGGVARITSGTLTMTGGTIQNCGTSQNGGAFYTEGTGTLALNDEAIITRCFANYGGGLYARDAFTLTNGEFNNCTASRNGGGIYANANITLTGVTIDSCSVGTNYYGGGFYANNTATLNDCLIFDNNAQRGGGLYFNGPATLDGCDIYSNTASQYGGGVYANNNLTLKNGTGVTSNQLSTNTVANGAGIYLVDSKTLILGDTSIATEYSTVTGNETTDGEESNVRLARSSSNNWINAVDVQSNLGDYIGVCNPGAAGTRFGTDVVEGTTVRSGLSYLTSDINNMEGVDGYTLLPEYSRAHVYWREVTEPIPPICKITDEAGNLLHYSDREAVFATLKDAVNRFQTSNFVDASNNPATPTHIKMLVDGFSVIATKALEVKNRSFTLTTAEKTDAQYPYDNNAEWPATIYKGRIPSNQNGIFMVCNTEGEVTLTFSDIVMDGRSNADVPVPTLATSANGACIASARKGNANATKSAIVLANGTTIQNCRTSSSGAVSITNGGDLLIEDGVLFTNCINNSAGGAVRVTGAGSILTMTGGTVQNGASKSSGGAFYSTSNGVIDVRSGSFQNLTSSSEGGAIYVTGSTLRFDTPADATLSFQHCTSRYDGGAISVQTAPMNITNAGTISISECVSGQNGGAICTDSYPLNISNTGTIEITDCSATSSGAAIEAAPFTNNANSGTITITGCSTNSSGGGIYASGSSYPVNLTGTGSVTISDCTSRYEGGGIYTRGTLTVSGLVKIDDNHKGSATGALNNVYMANSSVGNRTINIGAEGLLCGSHIGVSNNTANNRKVATGSEANCKYAGANHFFFDDTDTYRAYCLNKNAGSTTYTADKIYFIESWRNVADANGVSIDGDIITVNTAAGLAYIAKQVNSGETYEGKTIKLNADLDLNKLSNHVYNWEPIGMAGTCTGNDARAFKGSFDGQGHIISNLNSFLPYKAMGLFGYIEGGTITNTFIESGTLEGTYADGTATSEAFMGGLIGETNDVTISYSEAMLNMTNTSNANCIMGGLVGRMDNEIIHSSMAMPEMTNGTMMGGLVGQMDQGTIENSFANPEFNIDDEMTTWTIGGLAGSIVETEIGNCYVMQRGTVPTAATGKAFGWLSGDADEISVHHCYIPDGYTNYFGSGTESVSASGAYTATALVSGKYGYGHNDQKVGENDHLVDLLNGWVKEQSAEDGYAHWTRTMASPINGDYPVPMMPGFDGEKDNVCLASKDGLFITYNNDLDAQIDTYNKTTGGGNIYLYGVPDKVDVSTDEDVRVYIDGDIGIEQGASAKINARVGVMLDNSKHDANLWGMPYDWHMFSSALKATPLGLEYHTTESDYVGVDDYALKDLLANNPDLYVDATTYANANGEMDPPKTSFSTVSGHIGYFPTDTPYGRWRGTVPATPYGDGDGFDFYCYSEEYRHWVNFKREGTTTVMDHWHQNADSDGNHYKLQYFNDNNSVLKPGKGYMAAIGRPSMLMADGVLNNGDVTVTANWSEGNSASEEMLSGMNLLGNPYQSYLDFERFANDVEEESWTSPNTGKVADNTYYVVDADKGGYVAYISGGSSNEEYASRLIHPHQGFMVRVNSEETLKFTSGMRVAGNCKDGGDFESSYFRGERPNYVLVNLLCFDGSGKRDLTTVEAGRPELGGAHKVSGLRLSNGLLFAHVGEESYQALFAPDSITEVSVRFRAFKEDVFTMRWSVYNGAFTYLHLVDNKTGTDIDCLTSDEYVFEGKPDDYLSRFVLKFRRAGYSVGEDSEPPAQDVPFAFIHGDNLVVNGEGRLEMFDLQGRMLRGVSLTGQQCMVSLPALPSGIYLLRLTGDRSVRTQKIFINKR